jgi:hypothetical protein
MLTYALDPAPRPLRVGAPFTLTIAVTNAGDDRITCNSIALLLPVGTDASDLIGAGAGLDGRPPDGWGCTEAGGIVTFTAPPGGVAIEGQGLVFTIAATANSQPGAATVTLSATGSPKSELPGTSWTVDKFPADFTLSDLTAVPPDRLDIAYGDTARLNWTATGAGVSCVLDYQPADGGKPVSKAVPNSPDHGAFTTGPLTRHGDVVFTLRAEVTPLGQDNPLIAQRQLTVTVESLSLTVVGGPATVGVNGLVRLAWDAPNADHCTIDNLWPRYPASGSCYFVLRKSHIFTITAVGGGSQREQKQFSVQVDPSIKPNVDGHVITGAAGAAGTSARDFDPARPGGPGGDAILTLSLNPLAMTDGAPVVPITLTGGAGGAGGDGGRFSSAIIDREPPAWGGNGGVAMAILTMDRDGPPVHYLINLNGGAGGPGGLSNGSGWPNGAAGLASGASLTIDGGTVTMPGGT